MRLALWMLTFLLLFSCAAEANMQIASRGRAKCAILLQPGATLVEQYAAEELAQTLYQITGAKFEIREGIASVPETAIILGPGPLAKAIFPEADLESFGPEQATIRTKRGRLLLAGGRPRGTLYAVYHFLYDYCGVRWWTPWAADIPRKPNLTIPDIAADKKPAFESRDPFWYPAFDGTWAARNFSNSQHARLEDKHGGKIIYKGFVHTFYPLVPPEKHFKDHPEWYSLLNGKRTVEGGQLCTTNPHLRDFLVERVKEWIRESPEANIISVSQNDWYGACQCPDCKAIDEREGSHAGTMLALVNYIAERIGKEYPHVAIDTLAYQYTRRAPKTIKPLSNVIVRLCSIECNFAAPLTDPSNAAFMKDMQDWSKISDRLYVWDYTTNFAHYIQPHPNWFSLGPNVRFFHQHGVRGLFEQGAYQSFGAEMAELRAWVLARLLWDPYQDDQKLIDEFLDGYYGKPAARYIRQYMRLMAQRAKGVYLTCFASPTAPFLNFDTLSRAERLWEQAEEAAKNDPERRWRVRIGRLPLRYVWLVRWTQLRSECLLAGAKWPLPTSRKAVADEWYALATGPGPKGWNRITHLNEAGLTPEAFVARFATDPADPVIQPRPKGLRNAPPPADIPGVNPRECVDSQESELRLANEGEWAEVQSDSLASNGVAVRMPGTHFEWAYQLPIVNLPTKAHSGTWRVYAVVRLEKDAGVDPGTDAFTAGVYDNGERASRGDVRVYVRDMPDGYRSVLLGSVKLNTNQYIWVAPTGKPGVKAVWVDRIYFVPDREAAP
jgi:hypothetical protein